MSHTMPGNPYEGTANHQASEAGYDAGSIAVAILALAYEQHTANLIALEQLEGSQQGLSISPYQAIIRQRMDVRRYQPRATRGL